MAAVVEVAVDHEEAGLGDRVLGFGAAADSARAEPSKAEPSRIEKKDDIAVGDTLQATRDVELDEAIIAKGSKVSVSGRKSAGGRVLLDVALADGHVVRSVPLAAIRTSFQRVDG